MTKAFGDLLAQLLLIHRLGYVHVVERKVAVGALLEANGVHLPDHGQRVGYHAPFGIRQVLEHGMHITRSIRNDAKLVVQDRQSLTHLGILRQVLGHVGVDVGIENHHTADDGQKQCGVE